MLCFYLSKATSQNQVVDLSETATYMYTILIIQNKYLNINSLAVSWAHIHLWFAWYTFWWSMKLFIFKIQEKGWWVFKQCEALNNICRPWPKPFKLLKPTCHGLSFLPVEPPKRQLRCIIRIKLRTCMLQRETLYYYFFNKIDNLA